MPSHHFHLFLCATMFASSLKAGGPSTGYHLEDRTLAVQVVRSRGEMLPSPPKVTVDSHAADMPAADLRHLLDRLQPRDSALRGHIVRFSAKPLAYTPRADVRVEQRPQLTAQHEQFRQDLAAIRTRLTGAPQAQRKVLDVSYRHEYWFVLNGVAVTLSDGELQAIRRLPYVDQVSPDVAVHALLDQSVRQIGADRVQTEFGIKGSGVVVAVIDTGVDYLLPQLGGGLGAGFRVIGGYDFVNH